MSKRQPRSHSAAKQVEIKIDWDGAWITPPNIHSVKRALTATTTSIRAGDLHNAQVRSGPCRFFIVSEGRLFAWRGLLSRAIAALEQAGYQVQVRDSRELGGVQPDQRILDDDKVEQRELELLTSIMQFREGHVLVENPAEIPKLIALVCCLYPSVPILIPVRHNARAIRLHRQLSRCLLNVNVDLVLDGRWKWAGQIAVCSHAILQWYPVIRRRHVVLYPGLLDARPLRRDDRPLTWQTANSYAFIPATERLSEVDRLWLEADTGPQIHRYPRSECPPPTIKVLPVNAPAQRPAPRLDALTRKRQCVWHCEPRNQMLATMAQALRNKDVATLQELGLMVPEGADPFTEDREWTVMILVEGPEHGEQLHRLLPEWRLRTAVPLPPDRLPVIDPFANDPYIMTFVAAEGGGFAADILIRADGTSTLWRPAWGPDEADHESSDTVWIIDLQDEFDELACRDTQRRNQDYAVHGWMSGAEEAQFQT